MKDISRSPILKINRRNKIYKTKKISETPMMFITGIHLLILMKSQKDNSLENLLSTHMLLIQSKNKFILDYS